MNDEGMQINLRPLVRLQLDVVEGHNQGVEVIINEINTLLRGFQLRHNRGGLTPHMKQLLFSAILLRKQDIISNGYRDVQRGERAGRLARRWIFVNAGLMLENVNTMWDLGGYDNLAEKAAFVNRIRGITEAGAAMRFVGDEEYVSEIVKQHGEIVGVVGGSVAAGVTAGVAATIAIPPFFPGVIATLATGVATAGAAAGARAVEEDKVRVQAVNDIEESIRVELTENVVGEDIGYLNQVMGLN